MHKVLITGFFDDDSKRNLLAQGYELRHVQKPLGKDELKAELNGVNAFILGGPEKIDETILASASSLKVIAFMGRGYETFIDVHAATRHGVIVTYTPGANTEAVAEMTIGLILSLSRQIPMSTQNVKQGNWNSSIATELSKQILGIVGMGDIGACVARRAWLAFQMRIIYYSRSSNESIEHEIDAKKVAFPNLLKQADIVSLHCPLTPETKGMISNNELSLMKKTAFLINTARPDLVDPEALYRALYQHEIAGAAIDGYYTEPVPKPVIDRFGYKLLSLPDDVLIITPHSASYTREAIAKMSSMAAESVMCILKQKTFQHTANPEVLIS